MHVRSTVFLLAASGAAFYALGRYGHEVDWTEHAPPAIDSAQAQSPPNATPSQPATTSQPVFDIAQAPGAPGAPARPVGQQPQAQPQKVDESALRYFASQGDTRRYEAELARLRALFPDWRPPTDLTSQGQGPASDPELERMWKLFADGKLGEVRAAIAQRSSADPNWRAPADLEAQLDRAEAGQRLVNASNARQWEQVIRLGTETPALLTCANVDALWRVAEAFTQTAKPERARDAYAYVLTNCSNPAERVGTMQKAVATLPEALYAPLLAQERQSEFTSIRDELARRRVGAAAEDSAHPASPDDIRRIEALANASTTPDDAILLGFHALRHKDPAKAATWFQTALSRNGGAKAAEGAVLALAATQKYQEAEALGAQWLESGAANRKAYLDAVTTLVAQEPPPKLDRAVIERIAKTVGTDRYAPGAAALGWYAYNAGQIAPAGTWFQTALSWDRAYEPAAYGLALVHQRQRDQAQLRRIMTEWGGRSPRIASILDQPRDRSAARSSQAVPAIQERAPVRTEPVEEVVERRRPAPRPGAIERDEADMAPARSNVRAAPSVSAGDPGGSGTSAAAALQRGWRLLDLKRPAAAAEAFDFALRNGSGQVAADAAAGKTYAKLQQGLSAEAAVAASGAHVPPERRNEFSTLLLSERFYAEYEAKDYNKALVTLSERARFAPETTDLMMMRGWAYYNLGRYDDAEHVFQAVYRANGSSQAMAGISAVRAATKRDRY